MRTAGIRRLVEEALDSIPKPHTEDVIDDVFQAIENRPEWHQQYEELTSDLGRKRVNTWGGFWVANSAGRVAGEQVNARKSKLIESYAKLAKAPKRTGKKLKEGDALQTMSDYYRANKAKLPRSIAEHREAIIELLMEGFAVEEAFSTAIANGA